MRKRILTDTGFWLALFDPADQHHEEALSCIELVEQEQLIIPWPVLYEVFRTRFIRKPARVQEFRRFLARPNVMLLDDRPYRDLALDQFSPVDLPYRSLVDLVLRNILLDQPARINVLLTFNAIDFEDVCQERSIQLFP